MGTTGNDLVRGLDREKAADSLDRLHAVELVSALRCRAVNDRLVGTAIYVLPDELDQQVHTALPWSSLAFDADTSYPCRRRLRDDSTGGVHLRMMTTATPAPTVFAASVHNLKAEPVAGDELHWLQEQRDGRLRCSRRASP